MTKYALKNHIYRLFLLNEQLFCTFFKDQSLLKCFQDKNQHEIALQVGLVPLQQAQRTTNTPQPKHTKKQRGLLHLLHGLLHGTGSGGPPAQPTKHFSSRYLSTKPWIYHLIKPSAGSMIEEELSGLTLHEIVNK